MSKGKRTEAEYERIRADIIERFIDRGREFIELSDPESWLAFVEEKILGYHGQSLTDAQADFYDSVRETSLGLFSEAEAQGLFKFDPESTASNPFREVGTGRFVSFEAVKSFISGALNPFKR